VKTAIFLSRFDALARQRLSERRGALTETCGDAPSARRMIRRSRSEPRTLLASDGSILKLVAGVPYHLKVRTGQSTSLRATQGRVTLSASENGNGECVDSLDFRTESGAGPWRDVDRTVRACGDDAIMAVSAGR
jgi:hypothetical protein